MAQHRGPGRERPRGFRVGGAEDGHQGDAHGRGRVHQPRVVGDQDLKLAEHGQGLAQVRVPHQVQYRKAQFLFNLGRRGPVLGAAQEHDLSPRFLIKF